MKRLFSRAVVPALGLACLGVGVASLRPAVPSAVPTSRHDADLPQQLASALRQTWVGPGRLMGGSGEPPAAGSRLTVRRLEAWAAEAPQAIEVESALGLTHLLSGNVAEAITQWETSLLEHPRGAARWNDLAVAYLAGVESLKRPDWWIRALDAAERARRLAPGSAEPAHNRALALAGLMMSEAAAEAWAEALRIERRPHLRALMAAQEGEHRRRASVARCPSAPRDGGEQASALASERERWRACRGELRTIVENELIPQWAAAQLQGAEEAGQLFRRARASAALLRDIGGDALPDASLSRVSAATCSAPLLARAHVSFSDAVKASDEGDHHVASARAQEAQRLFIRCGSPYSRFAGVYRAIAKYMARDLAGAKASLGQAAGGDAPVRTKALSAWMLGLIAINENRLDDARRHYERASRLFEELGEAEQTARLAALLAEVHGVRGDATAAWAEQRRALAHLDRITVPRRRHVVLELGAQLAQREDAPYAALAFQDAAVDAAYRSQSNALLVEAYLQRARTLVRLEEGAGAQRDLEAARARVSTLAPESVRRSYVAELDAATADVMLREHPEQALPPLRRALLHYAGPGGAFRRSQLHLQRGRALQAVSQIEEAAAEFKTAIVEFERLRDGIQQLADRSRVFRLGYGAYEAMMRLAVRQRASPLDALEYVERSRGRTLLESLLGPGTKPTPLARLLPRLPADTAIVYYSVGQDEMYIWTVMRGLSQLHVQPVSRAHLLVAVSRLERLMRTDGPPSSSRGVELDRSLTSLYADVMAPAEDVLRQAHRVIIVPDGPLHRLPFAALRQSSGRYLVETHQLIFAPSLNSVLRASTPADATRRPLLLVGAPSVNGTGSGQAHLAAAKRELADIVRHYAKVRVLAGPAATRQAFLDDAVEANVVHFTGHAIANELEPAASYLQLTPDATTDGRLYAGDLRGVLLRNRPLVVLAACSTSRGRTEVGEGALSLARPFLEAGARGVIGTLWDIEDKNAADWFAAFHAAHASGLSPSAATAAVQREFLAARGWPRAHPSRWAWAMPIATSLD